MRLAAPQCKGAGIVNELVSTPSVGTLTIPCFFSEEHGEGRLFRAVLLWLTIELFEK